MKIGLKSINRKVKPHMFRHSMATHHYKSNKDILHRNLQSTLIYTHISSFKREDMHNTWKFLNY